MDKWAAGNRRVRKPSKDAVLAQARKHINPSVKGLIKLDVIETDNGAVLDFTVDYEALEIRKSLSFGKTLLFTNHSDWRTEEIVNAFRGQQTVETAIRRMKDPHYIAFAPMYCWTDHMVRVHAFRCTLVADISDYVARSDSWYQENNLEFSVDDRRL